MFTVCLRMNSSSTYLYTTHARLHLFCTFPSLRIEKEGNKTKTKKNKPKGDILARYPCVFLKYLGPAYQNSQGTEIRRTDWSTPILVQLMNVQPENNRG